MLVIGSIGCRRGVGGWDPERLTEAEETVGVFKQKDPELKKFFDQASGYAVFPTVAKAAVGVGGARGKGVVFENEKAVGEATLTQATIGFQLGGQAYSEIIFFEDQEALDRFKAGKFEVAAQATAVAVTVGASVNLAYSGGVAIVTMAKGGLMYEASVGGQKFSYEPFEE
jgi:lipid-binding SYLF domain-containing protein